MLKLRSLRGQRGDTILEVLIATAVLTLVLTIAYTAANRGTHAIRQSQERGESSRYTETQIELLKAFASQADPAMPPNNSKFCMNNNGQPVLFPSGAVIDNNAQNENFSAFTSPAVADCVKDGLYHNYIERNGDTYTAHTRWVKVNGKGIDEATMVHRIYPDLESGALFASTISNGCAPGEGYNGVGGCLPCPVGSTNPAGGFLACQLIPAQIQVKVQKIPPVGNTSPPCSNSGVDANGVSVRLNGPNVRPAPEGTSTALYDVNYSSSYTASIMSMPNGFELCSSPSPSPQQSTPTGMPLGSNQRTMTFKIRPTCTTIVTTTKWEYEFNGTYTPVVTGYNPYWSQGARRGDLDTIGPTSVYGTTGATVVPHGSSSTGYAWYYWSGNYGYVNGTHYSWYAAWEAVWNPNPTYTYVPNYQWNAYPVYTATCEP